MLCYCSYLVEHGLTRGSSAHKPIIGMLFKHLHSGDCDPFGQTCLAIKEGRQKYSDAFSCVNALKGA